MQPKPQANKTDKNKTEWNNPDPIYSEGIREQLEDYFYQALEVDLLLRLCPDEEDTIYQIVDLLVDTCSTKRKMLRIAGDDKPAEVVRSRLKKLNADHIKFVLDSLAENTAPVRNMKQYLLAMLYNAPTTMNLYYQNKTNHDFARGYTAEKEAAAQAEQDRLKAEEEAKKAAEEAAASGTEQPKENKVTKIASGFLGVVVLIALAAGGGFYFYRQQVQKKKAEKEALDPDANYTEDKGDFEIPTDVPDEDETPDEQDTEPI